jgi:hypothetical protein
LLHGFEVELEVGDGAAFEEVGFFAEDDLVDEAAAGGEGGGSPGSSGAGELGLEGLEEGHEVPDGEYVGLHEKAEVLGGADGGVEGVGAEAGAEGSDAAFYRGYALGGREFGSGSHFFIIAFLRKAYFI